MNIYNARSRLLSDFKFLFSILFLLIIIGLIFVYSASSVYGLENFGSSAFFIKKQLFCLGIGLIGLITVGLMPLWLIKKMVPIWFLLTLGLTSLTVLLPSMALKIHGSSRWITLGSFCLQPSELLKWLSLLYSSYILEKNWFEKKSFLKTFMPILFFSLVSFFILLRQPDFGLTVTLGATLFMLLFIARVKFRYLLGVVLVSLPGIAYLILTKAYRLKRILIFLNPWKDPKGAGFQVIQSLIAIGSGGGWGAGISHSKQKFFYLPMQHTDFIFSIIAEETGFIGASIIIFLYLIFAYQGTKIALQLKDHFSVFATLSFVIFTTLQALINLGVSTGLFPTKGIGLPFISYGGSAIIANCLMAGVLISCVRDYR